MLLPAPGNAQGPKTHAMPVAPVRAIAIEQ
jgi:hypothetical protein